MIIERTQPQDCKYVKSLLMRATIFRLESRRLKTPGVNSSIIELMAARYPHIDSEDEDVGYRSSSGSESGSEQEPVPEQGDRTAREDKSAARKLVEELSALTIQGNSSEAPEENQVADSWTVHKNSHPELDKYKALWATEQLELKQKLSVEDSPEVLSWKEETGNFRNLKLVGGVDISFIKGDAVNACAILVILEYPSLKLLHQVAYYPIEFICYSGSIKSDS